MRRLKLLLNHAYESVPYYHRVFDVSGVKPEDIRSLGDLSRLPVLRKKDVRSHSGEMMSSKYSLRDLEENSTSGSTSIPLRVYRTREEWIYTSASYVRSYDWAGMPRGEMAVQIVPRGGVWSYLVTSADLLLASFDVTAEKFERLLMSIRRLRPRFLAGYPSGLRLFTRFCEERGLSDIVFQSVLCSGEKIFDDEKRRMQRVFSADVYDDYATTETGPIGYDCSEHSGLHICSEHVLVEFLKDGEPAADGEMASLVVTPLFGYGMPLIRYEIGDVARSIEDTCPCGRGLPLMSYVDGRMNDILVTPDGRLLCNSNFHSRIFERLDVEQYRIIQERINKILVELVPGKKFTEKSEAFIVTSIKRYMGEEVDVSVELKNEIEQGSSQKRRIVVSHVPISL